MKTNLFNFRHSPKEFQTQGILSRVSRECRKSVGRLSTLLFLILLGLGFSTQAWANVYHIVGVAATNSNDYDVYVNSNRQNWDGTRGKCQKQE